MNQPTIKTAFKLIVAVIITFGLSLALQSILAQTAWTNPQCTPPNCNVAAPINVGSSTAVKTQGTWDNLNIAASSTMTSVGLFGVSGNFAVNPFTHDLFVDFSGGTHYVGIGTGSPAYKLDVNGTIQATGLRIPTGAAAGKVLTSDASGNASWGTGGGTAVAASGTLNPGNCGSWEVDTGIVLDSERFNPQRAFVPIVTTGSFYRYDATTKFFLTPSLLYRTCFNNPCNNYTHLYLNISCTNEEADSDYPSSIYWKVFEVK